MLAAIGFFYFAGVPASQAYQTEISPTRDRGLAFGIFFSIGSIPGALSPYIFGVIGDTYGLAASIAFLAGVSILGAVAALFLEETPNRKKEARHEVCIESSWGAEEPIME